MPPSDKIDTQFLKGTVAAVLVRACSECAVARPDDPVQFVAGWLDKYVQNDGILMKHAISKTAAEEDAEAAATAAQEEATKAENGEIRMSKAMEHLRSLTGDPDILYKQTANYALRLSGVKPQDVHVYVAALDEEEEDEMAGEEADGGEGGDGGDGGEEPAEEPAAADGEGADGAGAGDGSEKPIDYSDKFFRYTAAAGGKKGSGDWIIGKTLKRGADQGVSYALVDGAGAAAPEGGDGGDGGEGGGAGAAGKPSPWIDIPNVMTHSSSSSSTAKVHFHKGFPRVGAYFAAPIVLATGEVAGMLCADTLKTPAGGSGKPLDEANKRLIREVAQNAAAAMDAAAEARAAALALVDAEQAALAEALAAAEAPEGAEGAEGGEEGADGGAAAAPAPAAEGGEEAEPEPPMEPLEGESEEDFAARCAKTAALKAAAAADEDSKKKAKRFACLGSVLGELDNNALAEIRSYPRAPKATFKAVKACLYIAGHKKFEFETWSLTRKQIGVKFVEELKAVDPSVAVLTDKAEKGVRACLKGLKDVDVMKESKAGAVFFRWVETFRAAAAAAAEAKKTSEAVAAIEAAEAAAEAAAAAEAVAAAEAAAAAAPAEGEGEAAAPPAE